MNEQLIITCLPDGTYHVKETEDKDEPESQPAIDQTVKSSDDVVALVKQFFDEEAGEADDPDLDPGADPGDDTEPDDAPPAKPTKAAWNQEAAMRDPASGYRK